MKFPKIMVLWVAWLAVLCVGGRFLWLHEHAPAKSGRAPLHWPTKSGLQHEPGLPTLVLAAHPRCPCVHATLEELADLLNRSPRRMTAYVLFFKPPDQADDWAHTEAWREAEAIPGVTVAVDEGGLRARQLGCEVSGDIVLYSAFGDLQFHGGITASRGEAGDNASLAALRAVLAARSPRSVRTAVFGCSLLTARPSILSSVR